jgi:hypothetical protein
MISRLRAYLSSLMRFCRVMMQFLAQKFLDSVKSVVRADRSQRLFCHLSRVVENDPDGVPHA